MVAEVCPHCGLVHNAVCPRIKAIDYYQDGTVKRVEYHEQKATIGQARVKPLEFRTFQPGDPWS